MTTNYIYITTPNAPILSSVADSVGRLFKVGYTKHPNIRQSQLHSEARAKYILFYSDLRKMPKMYATPLQTTEKRTTLAVEKYVLNKVLTTKGVTWVDGEYFWAPLSIIQKCRRNMRRWVREALALVQNKHS